MMLAYPSNSWFLLPLSPRIATIWLYPDPHPVLAGRGFFFFISNLEEQHLGCIDLFFLKKRQADQQAHARILLLGYGH